MAKAKDQADGRRNGVVRDQHEREYFVVIEKATGDPCCAFQPKYEAPLYPEMGYCRVRKDEPNRFDIQYEAWIQDLRAAHQERRREEARFRAQRVTDDVIAEMLGPPPRPAAPVIAAKQGNRYVLGLRMFDPNNAKDQQLRAALEDWHGHFAIQEPDFSEDDFTEAEEDEAGGGAFEAGTAVLARYHKGEV